MGREEGIVAVDTSGAFKMIRCINRASQHGQKTRNKILTDHFLFLLGVGCARCPKGAKMGSERPSADRFQAVSDTIARDRRFFAKWTLFAHRSLLLHCTSRETDGGTTDRVIDAFAPFEGLALRYIEDDRSSCSIGVLAAFDGL